MQVFLGSPFLDLKDVRLALHEALESQHSVSWMEDFGSQEVESLVACLRLIDDADAYVLLFGASYGTRLPGSDYSYTHLEYEHAEQTGTPVLAYVQKLATGKTRDARAEDFLLQVKSSHQVEYQEFESTESLGETVLRDLKRLQSWLLRPKFSTAAPVGDEESYLVGALRAKVLAGAPFPTTLVDASAVADRMYRPEKQGRVGKKVVSIARVASRAGALVQVFNDFPVKRKGDIVKLKAERVKENSRLIVILVPKETTKDVIALFDGAQGERAVFHGDWFDVPAGDFYVEDYSEADLNSCDLRASVVEFIEARITDHVTKQLG